MNILTYKCRGASSKSFFQNICDLLQLHKPFILFLLEPRMPSSLVEHISRAGNFDGCGSQGLFRGNLVLLDIEIVAPNDQMVTSAIKSGVYIDQLISAVYASPKVKFRSKLWKYMQSLAGRIEWPWLITGDFNQRVISKEQQQ